MNGSPRVDILCDGSDKVGFGHIRRSLTLAAQLELEGATVRLIGLSEQSRSMLPPTTSDDFEPAITIFDSPLDVDERINRLTEQGRLSVALDYFGCAIPDVSIAVFAHQHVRAMRASYVGFEYILIRDEISILRGSPSSGRASRVMVMVGGGDILGHGHVAARTLAAAGCDVTLVQGPFSVNFGQCSSYAVRINPPNLPELFVECDWAVTSGGGSLFEGLCLGKAVHVLPQTVAEMRIAQYVDSRQGLLGIGLDSLRAYSELEVAEVAKKGEPLVDGLGARRVSEIVRSWL
jgi:spore coat polysaccharide biosynthesis predicted glycosyltransferase SpsG